MKRNVFALAIAGITVLLGDPAPGNRVAAKPVTSAITLGDVVQRVDATGTVEAVTTVQVGTQDSATVESHNADFNSTLLAKR